MAKHHLTLRERSDIACQRIFGEPAFSNLTKMQVSLKEMIGIAATYIVMYPDKYSDSDVESVRDALISLKETGVIKNEREEK